MPRSHLVRAATPRSAASPGPASHNPAPLDAVPVVRRSLLRGLLAAGATPAFSALSISASVVSASRTAHAAADRAEIPVGILHSLSGTMAISETALKDVALMEIDAINRAGGVLGRPLRPVVVDPASSWPLFAEKARDLLTRSRCVAVFGCWTSVSRKSVLPVFEELNGLLFYPVQYEGEELSRHVFYTGAAPSQQAIPALEYLMSEEGGGFERFFLLGTDYVYPRTTNRIVRGYLAKRGVAEAHITEAYTPFGFTDYQTIVSRIRAMAAGGRTAVVSTVNGDSNVAFYKELGNAGIQAADTPVMAFSVGEEELRGVDARNLVGHLAAWNYFMSVPGPANRAFLEQWSAWARAQKLPSASKPLTNDPMEATVVGLRMWKAAVEQAGRTDIDAVRDAMIGQKVDAPSGFTLEMDRNHHLHKPVFVGEIRPDGQFEVVWQSPNTLRAQPWSPYLPGNAGKTDAAAA